MFSNSQPANNSSRLSRNFRDTSTPRLATSGVQLKKLTVDILPTITAPPAKERVRDWLRKVNVAGPASAGRSDASPIRDFLIQARMPSGSLSETAKIEKSRFPPGFSEKDDNLRVEALLSHDIPPLGILHQKHRTVSYITKDRTRLTIGFRDYVRGITGKRSGARGEFAVPYLNDRNIPAGQPCDLDVTPPLSEWPVKTHENLWKYVANEQATLPDDHKRRLSVTVLNVPLATIVQEEGRVWIEAHVPSAVTVDNVSVAVGKAWPLRRKALLQFWVWGKWRSWTYIPVNEPPPIMPSPDLEDALALPPQIDTSCEWSTIGSGPSVIRPSQVDLTKRPPKMNKPALTVDTVQTGSLKRKVSAISETEEGGGEGSRLAPGRRRFV